MNVSESNDLNVLLGWLVGHRPGGLAVPTEAEALAAAERLAGRANRALLAGLNGSEVRRLWARQDLAPQARRYAHLIERSRDVREAFAAHPTAVPLAEAQARALQDLAKLLERLVRSDR